MCTGYPVHWILDIFSAGLQQISGNRVFMEYISGQCSSTTSDLASSCAPNHQFPSPENTGYPATGCQGIFVQLRVVVKHILASWCALNYKLRHFQGRDAPDIRYTGFYTFSALVCKKYPDTEFSWNVCLGVENAAMCGFIMCSWLLIKTYYPMRACTGYTLTEFSGNLYPAVAVAVQQMRFPSILYNPILV